MLIIGLDEQGQLNSKMNIKNLIEPALVGYIIEGIGHNIVEKG